MSSSRRVGLLGGTFDPIHVGHLEAAEAARRALGLDAVLFVPSRVPPHRTVPRVSAYHRFAMVVLALDSRDDLIASDIELTTEGPSYTIDTLRRLRQLGDTASKVFFVTGADAFAEIATWRDYPALLDASHFAVVSRSGLEAQALRDRLPALADRMQALSVDAAATLSHRSTRPSVPDTPTIFLIHAKTSDVSSTEIRQRLAAGESVEALLPASVEAHIRRYGLYGARGAVAIDLHDQT